MKLQDMVFFAVLVGLLVMKNPRYFAYAGLLSIFTAIPLFSFWIFFTAQRLTWYAAAFFSMAIVLSFFTMKEAKT